MLRGFFPATLILLNKFIFIVKGVALDAWKENKISPNLNRICFYDPSPYFVDIICICAHYRKLAARFL
jgi:hypothetical protein